MTSDNPGPLQELLDKTPLPVKVSAFFTAIIVLGRYIVTRTGLWDNIRMRCSVLVPYLVEYEMKAADFVDWMTGGKIHPRMCCDEKEHLWRKFRRGEEQKERREGGEEERFWWILKDLFLGLCRMLRRRKGETQKEGCEEQNGVECERLCCRVGPRVPMPHNLHRRLPRHSQRLTSFYCRLPSPERQVNYKAQLICWTANGVVFDVCNAGWQENAILHLLFPRLILPCRRVDVVINKVDTSRKNATRIASGYRYEFSPARCRVPRDPVFRSICQAFEKDDPRASKPPGCVAYNRQVMDLQLYEEKAALPLYDSL